MTTLAQDLVKFEQVAQACHWTEQQFHDTLISDGVLVFTYYKDNRLMGYLLSHCVLDECELLQISVHPAVKRQGIGYQLIQQFIDKTKQSACSRILLEVRESNDAAIALYQKVGFKIDCIRKGYYPHPTGIKENAILMSVSL
jgi:ribosomal-protein-alanine acetyltransferase